MSEVPAPRPPVRLVVLAGAGQGPRRTAKPIPLVEVAGLSLIERVLAGGARAGFAEVVVVTNDRADSIGRHVLELSRRRALAVRVLPSSEPWHGGESSAAAGRAGVAEGASVVVRADRVLPAALLERLARTAVASDEVVVAVAAGAPGSARPGDRTADGAPDVPGMDAGAPAVGDRPWDHGDSCIGALVCGPALVPIVQTTITSGDSDLSAAIRALGMTARVRALPVDPDERWFEVESAGDRRRARRHLVRSAAKPHDGTIAARFNLALSLRVTTPAVLALGVPVTPNQVTLLAFLTAVLAAVSFAVGLPALAGLLVALASVLDRSDGEVARLTHRSSAYGGFFDAVLDRAADGLLFTGATIYLATDAELSTTFGDAQIPLAVLVVGLAAVSHQLVSYTTAKAAVELGHGYRGKWLGGGKGRDRRLLLVTVGAFAAVLEPAALLIAFAAVAVLASWIVIERLRQSWWAAGLGADYVGVSAVALDFDGTIADSMGFLTQEAVDLLVDELGFSPAEAMHRYVTTTGSAFAAQLDELAPGDPRLADLVRRFEVRKARWMVGCEAFPDVVPAVDRLVAAGVPLLLCSSTDERLVRDFCERHGLMDKLASVDGWRPGHDKRAQLAAAVAAADVSAADVLFVGDAWRDRDMAAAVGTRFVGLVRAGGPDALAGSGAKVVGSLAELATNLLRAADLAVTGWPPP